MQDLTHYLVLSGNHARLRGEGFHCRGSILATDIQMGAQINEEFH